MYRTINLIKSRTVLQAEIKSYAQVLLGSLILSFGYAIFIVPHHIVPGGIIGFSIIVNHLTNLSVGLVSLMINIPLLLWGTKVLGKKAGFKTAFSMILVSIFIDGFSYLINGQIMVDDILVSTIFGGILIGLSVTIVMDAGATTGGNDILVRIIAKKIKLPFNQLMLFIDAIIVFLGVIVFKDFTMAAYCVIAIVAISKTVEHFMKKNIQNKTILVFSNRNKDIQHALNINLQLSENIVKLIHHDSDHKMTIITKNTKKLGLIEQVIHDIDHTSHITILESNTNFVHP